MPDAPDALPEKIYRDDDVPLAPLEGKTLAVLGYGIQGRAQAANARDSGCSVIVGTAHGAADAARDGFEAHSIGDATATADVLLIELADPVQPLIWREAIEPNLSPGKTLVFCHGFNVLYGQIDVRKDCDCTLFVPNAPGKFVRAKYEAGEGVYGCVAVDHDATGHAREIVFAVSKAVGSTRAGVVELSFQHETEGDNFEEQILYGGTIALMKLTYQTMVDAGYPRSFAYAKAIRSLRSVVDVIDEVGIEPYVSGGCSRTCEFAIRTRGPRVVNADEVRKIFDETERGLFARDWMQEFALGMPQLHRLRRTGAESDMERTGRAWREQFGK